jgi:ABC-2 type transport system permease protein
MLVAYRYLLREGLRLRKMLPWLGLAIVAFLFAANWGRFDPGSTNVDKYVNVVNLLTFRLLPLAAAIYSTMIVAQEVEQKTIVYLLTRPIPRWQLILGRWAATASTVVIISIIGLIAAQFGSEGGGSKFIARDLLALALGAAAYTSLFMFVTLLFNRALIICVLFAFGWESSIPNMPAGLQGLSILSHMQAIAKHPDGGDSGGKILDLIAGLLGKTDLNPLTSGFGLLVFSVVMVGLSAYWFSTHEFIPREDSE